MLKENGKMVFLIMVFFSILFLSSNVMAEDVVLKYLTHSTLEEPARTIILNGIAKFEKDNPNIKIDVESVPNDQIQQKAVTYAKVGMFPDLVGLQGMGIEPFASDGNLLDITDKVKEDKLADQFMDLEAGKGLDGKVYGLPLYGGTDALYYNPKLFKEVGLDPDNPPKTYEELLEYAQKLTKPDIGQYGMGIYGATVHAVRIMHYMSNAGSREGRMLKLNEDKKSWDILVNSPTSLKGWQFLNSLVKAEVVPPNTVELTYPDLISLFAQEKVAMITTGPWGIATIKSSNPDIEFKISQHPTIDGSKPVLRTAPLITAISSKTEHPAEAYKFLKYMTINVGVELAANGYGIMTQKAANDPRIAKNPQMVVFANQQENAYFSAQELLLPEWLQVKDQAWGPAWENMLIGNLTPEEAVNQAARDIKDILGSKGNLIYPVK